MYLAKICGVLVLLAGTSTQVLKTTFVFQDSQPAPTQPPPVHDEAQATSSNESQSQEQPKPDDALPVNPDSTVKPDDAKTSPAENQATETTPAKPASKTNKPPVPPTAKTPVKKNRVKRQPVTRPDGAKVVVKNGSTADPKIQLSSGGTQQATQQIQSANSLLDATNTNLKKISDKKLDATQQDMVKQIMDYIEQSKSAAAAGDPHGAQTLATKAHLLSEELVKP
jgi:hypothetical protein